ncbi:MAG: helix-turn-helix transcriptional regulator [Bifidobacteriaceae bacterium]|jgi:transcriptional regulator with XRE-family HTH domain|nr:helix-turn-helix transcriptional regulator [Bifidobacteriaceae bacterium]
MGEASTLLAQARSARQLTMNALAEASGVPVSTISRIESGKVEPTWSVMDRILSGAGFRLESALAEAGSDQPFAHALRRLDEAAPRQRAAVIRRFPAIARLALVARRTGARRVRLDRELGTVIRALDDQGARPVVSSLEAYLEDASRARSFSPVVYVDDPTRAGSFANADRTSPAVVFLLPTTDNVRAVCRDVRGTRMVSREWGLLDSLASPGRQPDATEHLIDDLISEPAP